MAGWRAPAFWAEGSVPPWPLRLALAPVSALLARVSARRGARAGLDPGVPVLCVGNVSVGGTGKTIVTLDLLERLRVRGVAVHVLTRGYGGTVRGPHRVAPDDDAAAVGDEALLLAACAPVWVGGDRVASARAAVAAGAQALVMDDGLQNPGLRKHVSLLVVDAAAGFGNGRLLPLGPLREPLAQAAARCTAEIRIGEGVRGLRTGLPVLAARLVQAPGDVAALRGQRVFAFAGIGRPEKFFAGLRAAGLQLVGTRALGDHQAYTPSLRAELLGQAERLGAVAVTTAKDVARWGTQEPRPSQLGVGLAWQDEAAVETLLSDWLERR